MRFPKRRTWVRVLIVAVLLFMGWYVRRVSWNHSRLPGVPQTWETRAIETCLVPLANRVYSPRPVTESTYYWTPIRTLYKTYPVYHPDHEPEGYIERLRNQEPEAIWDTTALKTDEDWRRAGELVFDAPLGGASLAPSTGEYSDSLYVRDLRWHEAVRAPLAKDGTLPFYRYIIDKKGRVRVGILSCAMCHTRVLDDGSVVKGAQGNFPFDRAFAYDFRNGGGAAESHLSLERLLYHAPWHERTTLTTEQIAARHEAIPAGVMARHGSSPEYPVVIPDLFNLTSRRFLDRTGLQLNRGDGDLMRYAALNQGGDDFSTYSDFVPVRELVGFIPPAILNPLGRYSDDQLYALVVYLKSLSPPENPYSSGDLVRRGEEVFYAANCDRCHAPPDYTSHKLTPAVGFEIPADHLELYPIEQESVGTDPGLAMETRRGTGYYKIPSLKHVWLRGPFGHDGSCATLEDWFDPRRLQPDYRPTGFVGLNVERRAVPGHEFGLELSVDDRKALIAFLKSL